MRRSLPLIGLVLLLAASCSAARGGYQLKASCPATVPSAGTASCTATLTPVPPNGAQLFLYGWSGPVSAGHIGSFSNGTAAFTVMTKSVTKATPASFTVNAESQSVVVSLTVEPGTTAPTYLLSAVPASGGFGSVTDGATLTLAMALRNSGTGTVDITGISESGSTEFSTTGLTAITAIAPGASAPFSAIFKPTAAGAASGSIAITSNATTLSIPLSGTGVATPPPATLTALACVPGTITGAGSTDCTATLSSAPAVATTVTLTSSNSAVTVPPDVVVPAGSGMGIFTGTAEAVTAATPVTLTATLNGASVTFPLLLDPVTTVSYQVNLTWSAPASSPDPVAGYHVYRATSGSGTYALVTASVNVPTSFTDSNVTNGATYTYEVTSVDASGVESAPSNVYMAAIP